MALGRDQRITSKASPLSRAKADVDQMDFVERLPSGYRSSSPGTDNGWTMRGISTGQIVLIVVLGAVLILTGVWAVSVWRASSGVEMGKHGWIARWASAPSFRSSSGAGLWR